MLLPRRALGALGVLGATSLTALAACGRDAGTPAAGGSSTLVGSIRGAGATSQSSAQEAWMNAFMDANLRAAVDYAGGGSGAGRTKLVAGAVDFAGSDAVLDAAQVAELGGVVEVPLYVSPVAIVYNLPGFSGNNQINMTGDVLARVLAGRITSWRDPAIVALNEDAELPDLDVIVVHRSDDSGTTRSLTAYLSHVAPHLWPQASDTWPGAGHSGDGTSGVVQTVSAARGAIGYADASKVPEYLGTVAVGERDRFLPASAEAAATTLEASEVSEASGNGSGARISCSLSYDVEGGYPIVLVSYLVARQGYDDAAVGSVVRAYLGYLASQEGQELAAQRAGCVPLPESLRGRVASAVSTIGS